MSEFLSKALLDDMERARRSANRKRTHMTVCAGGQEFTILRYWNTGFALDAADAPGLRGLVDVYSGAKHLCQALVVTSSEEQGERVYEVKRSTPAQNTAPAADFVRDRPEPAGLLPRH
ncbi:hypothetical protein [Tropicimonas isoalkanivorans]|uniref:Uncharacterized protein n=1 Tax=Tropicimonas isoalkanivorans TaxID=441112 RepID=A0A1I1PAC9_9RHOB|nr:hypothetical protein [Tropicimonas isoalkanivorans]SFD06749.1 hypothetical protein SAMN04488094_11487 [Tropicimonas isoalkanivorans]